MEHDTTTLLYAWVGTLAASSLAVLLVWRGDPVSVKRGRLAWFWLFWTLFFLVKYIRRTYLT